MQIELKGRNVQVNDEMREYVDKRFRKIGAQVSELARLEVEIHEEHNPSIPEKACASVTLYLKGITLHAHDSAREMNHAIHLCEEELARQVKRHREKRRKRRDARAARSPEALGGSGFAAM